MPCTSAKRKYDAKYGRDIPRSVYQSWGAVVSKERAFLIDIGVDVLDLLYDDEDAITYSIASRRSGS